MDFLKDLIKILVAIILLLPVVLVFNDNGNIVPNIIGLAYLLLIGRFRYIKSRLKKVYSRFTKIIRGNGDN